MKNTITYIASGLAKVKLGEGLWKVVTFPKIKFADKSNFMKVLSETLYGDNDKGLVSKGIVLRMVKETRIDDEDEVFIEREYSFESIGNLMDSEYFEMQEQLLNKTKQV